MNNSPIDELQNFTGKKWEIIKNAENESLKEKNKIADLF